GMTGPAVAAKGSGSGRAEGMTSISGPPMAAGASRLPIVSKSSLARVSASCASSLPAAALRASSENTIEFSLVVDDEARGGEGALGMESRWMLRGGPNRSNVAGRAAIARGAAPAAVEAAVEDGFAVLLAWVREAPGRTGF